MKGHQARMDRTERLGLPGLQVQLEEQALRERPGLPSQAPLALLRRQVLPALPVKQVQRELPVPRELPGRMASQARPVLRARMALRE